MKEYCTYILGEYVVTYDTSLNMETYYNEWYYGIIFTLNNGDKYDLCHNHYMGDRLHINKNGHWQDIPLKKSSFQCLPELIKVIEIGKD